MFAKRQNWLILYFFIYTLYAPPLPMGTQWLKTVNATGINLGLMPAILVPLKQ
jgi:hypothetical protein